MNLTIAACFSTTQTSLFVDLQATKFANMTNCVNAQSVRGIR